MNRAFTLLSSIVLLASAQVNAASNANPVKGAELFKQCVACHNVGEGAQNLVGPNLNHVFGRKAGSVEGANYSDAMKAKGESEKPVWTDKSLYIFLAGPARYVPGTIMGFEGFKKEKEIKDLLAFLIQYSPAYEEGSGKTPDPAAIAAAVLPPPPAQEDENEEVPEFGDAYMASADAIATGDELWGKQCRHCHGNSAYPGKAPKLKPASYEPDFVFDRITNGFKKMPAWKSVFSLDERKALVAYVLSDKFSP